MRSRPSPDPKRWLRAGPRRGFPLGESPIFTVAGTAALTKAPGFSLTVMRLRRQQRWLPLAQGEYALVLLAGSARFTWSEGSTSVARASLFDEGPSVFHAPAGEQVEVLAGPGGAEFAVVGAENPKYFVPRLFVPGDVREEDRGAGLVQGACRRTVRAVFDHETRPESQLVLGEVVNFPGRWSSYPPHHHPQPEIYHYRLTDRRGYGHAELGDDVVRIQDGDTVLIPGGLDHAQVSAPGYGLYYLWVVRHLPRRPYRGFQFTAQHTWLLDPKRQGWLPPAGTLL